MPQELGQTLRVQLRNRYIEFDTARQKLDVELKRKGKI